MQEGRFFFKGVWIVVITDPDHPETPADVLILTPPEYLAYKRGGVEAARAESLAANPEQSDFSKANELGSILKNLGI